MGSFLSSLRISHKIWGGFAVLLLILFVVALSAIRSFQSTESHLRQVIELDQPTIFTAMNLRHDLEQASTSLGYYLLSKEASHRRNYISGLSRLNRDAQQLLHSPLVEERPDLANQVKAILSQLHSFAAYKDRMLKLAVDQAANMPAAAYAADNVNPLARQLQQDVDEMLNYGDGRPSARQVALLQHVYNLRYALVNVINEVRTYLAFRNKDQVSNINIYVDQMRSILKKLRTHESTMSFEQSAAYDDFKQSYPRYKKSLKQLEAIQGGEKWR
ncbi:MAG: MCP four helix bundle domain-containing protein, partial [Gammaproteobacteria bacterium]